MANLNNDERLNLKKLVTEMQNNWNFMKSSMSQMGQVCLIVGCYWPSWFVWLIENLSTKIQVRALVYCRYHIAILNLCQTVNNGLSGMLCDFAEYVLNSSNTTPSALAPSCHNIGDVSESVTCKYLHCTHLTTQIRVHYCAHACVFISVH